MNHKRLATLMLLTLPAFSIAADPVRLTFDQLQTPYSDATGHGQLTTAFAAALTEANTRLRERPRLPSNFFEWSFA